MPRVFELSEGVAIPELFIRWSAPSKRRAPRCRAGFGRGRNLFVCVSDFNDGARRFYARQGYAHVGTLPDLIVRGSAELLLRKTAGPIRATR